MNEAIWNSVDLTRAIFLIGAVFALAYKKRYGVTPGGVIVPGTLAIVLFASFVAFIITIVTSIVSYFIYKFTFGRYPLDKRWSALINVTISTLLGLVLMYSLEITRTLSTELLLISLVIPGLIAINARKYSPAKVAVGTFSVVAASYLAGALLYQLLPYSMISRLSTGLGEYQMLSLLNPFIALPLSLLLAITLYYRFGIRSGGYLIAPYLAVVTFSSPIQALLLAAGVALSYLATKIALRYTLLIGLERFVFSLFCGYIVVTLIDIIAVHINIPGYRPAPLILITAVAVLTNDLSLQPLKSTLKNGFGPAQFIAHLLRWAT